MENKFKVSLYIRVSTGRQASEGDSLEEQEKELKKFCEYKNYLIHKTHIERGKSAKDTNRAEYQKLLEDVKAKRINAVVVKKLDRLSRSLLDFEDFMLTAQNNEVEFISLKENFDTTNAMGKAMLRVALVFAQLEREQTSERVKDVMAYRAENGLHNGGKPAYGYDLVNKGLVPHKQERKIIELIFNKFIETKSTLETAKALNALGYRNRMDKLWDCRKILQIIKNPLYIGKVNWADKQYPGLHQPLIPEKIFDQVQIVFQKKGSNFFAYTNTNALLRGLLICGYCHNMMTPSHSLNSQKKKFFYYRCTSTINHAQKKEIPCKIKYVAFKTIEPKITSLLLSLTRESQFKLIENKILKHNQAIDIEAGQTKTEVLELQHKLGNIKSSKDRYLDSLISSQFLSLERKKINDKLEALALEEKQTQALLYKKEFELSQKTSGQIDLTEFKQALVSFKKDYDTFSDEHLRNYLIRLLKEIVYSPDTTSLQFHLLPWPLEFEDEKTVAARKDKPAKQSVLA